MSWIRVAVFKNRSRAETVQLPAEPESPPEGSACSAHQIGPEARRARQVPSGQKRPAAIGTAQRRALSLRRRMFGSIILLAGTWLLLASQTTVIASDASTAPLNAGTPQSAGKTEANKTALAKAQPLSTSSETPTYLRDVLPILMGKCGRCHNDQTQVMQNWLDYRTAAAGRWKIKRRIWDSWKGAYFKQPMPIANSTESEAMTDEERATIRNWVESGAPCGVQPAFNSAQSKAERLELGKRLFTTICAACHQPTGQGIPGRFPPLAGSDFLNSDKHRAIRVVLNGLQGELTVNGQKFNNSMPRFPLTDDDIANALTYVYNSFGNSCKEVSPEEVTAARAEKEEINLTAQKSSPKVPEEKSPFE